MSRFALSDIHGCFKTFRYMVEEVLQLQGSDTLYLLGDYIDRGPDSKGVIDYIFELQEKGYQLVCLAGNHEDMLLQARDNSTYLNSWLMNGGKTALQSFGTDSLFGIPVKYWTFMEELKEYVSLDDYLLVHAGFDFEAEDPFADRESMLWIRDFEVDSAVLGNRKIVHGHTPIPLEEIKAMITLKAELINIDGGCVFASRNIVGYGYLTALNLDTLELHSVKNMDED